MEIRTATMENSGIILRLIKELAAYGNAENEVIATEADINESLFGADSTTHAVIWSINQESVGFAVYFFNYSTWLGKRGLYLEDLYVSPKFRGLGAGRALLKHLAKIALSKKCGRFEWNVRDSNESAIKFYESIGAKPKRGWVGYQLTGKALEKLATS